MNDENHSSDLENTDRSSYTVKSTTSSSDNSLKNNNSNHKTRNQSKIKSYGNNINSSISMPSNHSISSITTTNSLRKLVPASPRTKYISGCIRENLLPMPNIILRKNYTTTLNLSHYGINQL